MNRTSELKNLKIAVDTAITNHEKLSKSYFWQPGRNASSRRYNEKKNSFHFESFTFGVEIENDYSESCNHCYYKGYFVFDGKRVTVAALKKLSDALNYLV